MKQEREAFSLIGPRRKADFMSVFAKSNCKSFSRLVIIDLGLRDPCCPSLTSSIISWHHSTSSSSLTYFVSSLVIVAAKDSMRDRSACNLVTEAWRRDISEALVVTLPLIVFRILSFSSICLSNDFLVAVIVLSNLRFRFSCFASAAFWFARMSSRSLWSLAGTSPLAAIVTIGVCLPVGPVFGLFTLLLDLVFGSIPLIQIEGEVFIPQNGQTNITKLLVYLMVINHPACSGK